MGQKGKIFARENYRSKILRSNRKSIWSYYTRTMLNISKQ